MFGFGKNKKTKLDYGVGSHWKITNPISHREDYDGPSTCIKQAEYDEDEGNMKVQFRSSDKVYDYDVSKEEVEKFKNDGDGRSWGRSFLKNIANR